MQIAYDFTDREAEKAYGGKLPGPAKPGDVGIDLRAVTIEKKEVFGRPGYLSVGTGVRFKFPCGYYGELVLRSSTPLRFSVFLLGSVGIIDTGYRGEVVALLKCLGGDEAQDQIRNNLLGKRFVQLLLHRAVYPIPVRGSVPVSTARGETGSGSSGHD